MLTERRQDLIEHRTGLNVDRCAAGRGGDRSASAANDLLPTHDYA